MAEEQPEFHDVVVIGAGIAGLRCASQLVHVQGVKDVLVVDAMDRVGGRVLNDTTFIPGMSIEVGAEFMHGANTTLTRMAEEYNIGMREIFTWAQGDGGPTEPAPDGGIGYYYIGDQKRMLAYDDDDEEFLKFNLSVADLSDVTNVDEIPPEKSMRDYFTENAISPSMMKLAEAGYANTAGGPLEDISLRITCRYEKQWIELEDEGDYRVVPSFMRFVEHFAEGVTTRLNWPVASVEYSQSDRIVVTSTSGKKISCRTLVVTVATAVFSKITYTPALPQEKMDAVASFDMRRAGKVLLHMSGRFWPENAHGVICSDCFLPEFWINSTQGIGHLKTNGDKTCESSADKPENVQYLITGYAGALYAERFVNMDTDKIIQGFLDQLDLLYGTVEEPSPARKYFVKGMYKDWGDEEYVGGGYAFPRVGQSDSASRNLAEPVDGRVFFAGEATAFEQPGMSVHAAVDTGTRASVQVARALLEV
ncbi:hypothetical protein G195_002195 [Phytophthora kernoviae 00238/432]|uniref:Amine oxidase domain-containing protein n=1 Tax=Phytophthora kernoviae 00238/432 TaxID=1284355 RepID=A0A8J4WEB1_9STRA|nr:hypothetical protein G195_002195 [Phytophthora kernoviae 00238/432]